jgi:putative ABC transport system permease protein
MPIHNEFNDAAFAIVEHPQKDMQDRDDEDFRRVENGYFEAMRIPLLRGRLPTEHDHAAGANVLAIDEPFARRHFPNEDPIGKHIRFGEPVFEIIGIVGGVRNHNLRTPPRPTMYIPFTHDQSDRIHLVIRTGSDSATLAGAVRQIVKSEDPEVAISAFETMEQVLSDSVSGARFNALLLGLFSGLALVLGMAGVYGVFSYIVAQQTREIGVRMALGARPGQMLRLILGRGALLAGGGAVLGLAAAFFLTGVLSSQLYGVAPRDPVTFAGSALVLVTVALAACAIPARRAMRVDPLIALRCE